MMTSAEELFFKACAQIVFWDGRDLLSDYELFLVTLMV